MSIEIDFTVAPPTLESISEKREKAVGDRAVYRKKNIRFMIMMACIVIAYGTFMIVTVIPMIAKAEPDWGMITYFFPHFTFAIFWIGNDVHIKKIEKPSKLLDKNIASMTEEEVDKISSVINEKEQPDEIVSYMEQVTAQGRLLLGAEIEAIQKWHNSNKPGEFAKQAS